MVKELYGHKKLWENWISQADKKGIEELSKENSKLILSFLKDFSLGLNVSKKSKKGARSYTRLNHLKQKLIFITKLLQERGINDISKVKANQLHKLFDDMRKGVIKNRFGEVYKSVGDFVKNVKTFWHWHQKVQKKKNKKVEDITEDLDTRGEKAKFVYFTKEDFEKILKKASYDLKPILALAFDTGARVTELMNVKVSDFMKDYTELELREEASKTFGRRIKIMLCSKQIREYVLKNGLEQNDFVSKIHPSMINKELRSIGKKVLSKSQIKFKNLSMYDFRHSSACFWLPKYKSESAMKYRFGWKKTDMIHYYTEFLGMEDTITEDDLLSDVTKTELERKVNKLESVFKEIIESSISKGKKKGVTIKISDMQGNPIGPEDLSKNV